MRTSILTLLILTTAGCNPFGNGSPVPVGRMTFPDADFYVVLRKDGEIELSSDGGQSYRLISGSIEVSAGNGTLLIRKVKP